MKTKRYDGEEGSEVKEDTAPEDYGNEDKRTSDAAVVAPSGKKPKVITKEELGGKSLRDYLNDKQGLTRRGGSTSPPGSSSAPSKVLTTNKSGQPGGSPSDSGSGKDVVDRQNARASTDDTSMSVTDRARMSRERARKGSGPSDTRSVNERIKSTLGFSAGGSASSRADGIAQRGKTIGKMC